MKKAVYYAHSKLIYDTPREKSERSFLEKSFGKVCCPNRDIGEQGSIDPYLNRVQRSSQVICSEYQRHIGKGVFTEVSEALERGKKVFRLKKVKVGWMLEPVSAVKVVDEFDWKVCYGKLILKGGE